MNLFLLSTGIIILLLSGDFLVRAAVVLSTRLSVQPLIIGLTVVAFGTSAPELIVAIQATLNELGTLALGNIIGSNIANAFLVLGFPALITSIQSNDRNIRANYFFMLGSTILFIIVVIMGDLYFWNGTILLLLNIYFVFWVIKIAKSNNTSHEVSDFNGMEQDLKVWKLIIYFVIGVAGLPLGANILIMGATGLAVDFGISNELIGLSIVAIGTSLPELATSISSAFRKQAGLLLGNVIGSNMFNLLGVAGSAALFGKLNMEPELKSISLLVLFFSAIILLPFILNYIRLNRIFGFSFLVIYVAYLSLVF